MHFAVTLGDQLFEAALRGRAAARPPGRRRWRLSHPLAALVAGVLLAGGAASAALVLTSQPSCRGRACRLGPSQYAIDMSPDLQVGQTGWCVGVISTEQRRFRGWSEECGGAPGLPIVAESFAAPEPKHATLNWAITTSAVAAVRFGDHVVRTRSEPRLPNGFRAAVEIVAPGHGLGPGRLRVVTRRDGIVDVQTRPRPVEALNARGQAIHYLALERLQSGTVLGHVIPAKRRIPWWSQKTGRIGPHRRRRRICPVRFTQDRSRVPNRNGATWPPESVTSPGCKAARLSHARTPSFTGTTGRWRQQCCWTPPARAVNPRRFRRCNRCPATPAFSMLRAACKGTSRADA